MAPSLWPMGTQQSRAGGPSPGVAANPAFVGASEGGAVVATELYGPGTPGLIPILTDPGNTDGVEIATEAEGVPLILRTATTADGANTGSLLLVSGNVGGGVSTSHTGEVQISSGNNTTAGNTGSAALGSGNAAVGNTGDTTIITGSALAPFGVSGDIDIDTGPASTTGEINLGQGHASEINIGRTPDAHGPLIGFFGATPVTQGTATGNTNVVTLGTAAKVFVDTTFDGGLGGSAYTIGDLVLWLKQSGQLAP